jgi:hypothetical protein
MILICTTFFNTNKTLHFAHMLLCVLYYAQKTNNLFKRTTIYFGSSTNNQLISVMETLCVFSDERTGKLSLIAKRP